MDPIKATVKWFRGSFGFLTDGDQDYFVHYTGIIDDNAPEGRACDTCEKAWKHHAGDSCPGCGGEVRAIRYLDLAELQEVEILEVVDQGMKGLKAAKVRKL